MLWFLIWFLLSAFVLGAFFWSIRILLLQKRAWKIFATKMGFTYNDGGRFLESPSVAGSLGRLNLNLFTERKPANDARGERFVTALELVIPETMPMSGAVCTESMVEIITPLRLTDMTVPEHITEWNAKWRIRSDDTDLMARYLTGDRYEVLKKIFRMNVLAVLFIFDRHECVLRLETTDPLGKADKLEKIVKSLTPMVEKLALHGDERTALFSDAKPEQQMEKRSVNPSPDAEQPQPQGLELQLEDDE